MLASAFTLLPFVGVPAGGQSARLPADRAAGRPGAGRRARCWCISPFRKVRAGTCGEAMPQAAVDAVNLMIRRCGNRVPELTVGELGPNLTLGARGVAAVHGVVPRRTTALDRGRHPQRHQRQHRVLHLRDPAAQGAGGSGRRRRVELRSEFGAVPGQHPRQIVHRLSDGGHRPALDHDVLARRFVARHRPHGRRALGGRACPGGVHRGRPDHGLHRAVGVSLHAGLPVRAIPHRVARTRSFLW